MKEYQKVYRSFNHKKFGNTNYYITGIDNEVKKYNKDSIDNFLKDIINVIKDEPIGAAARQYILNNMKIPSYYDYSVLVLHLKSTDMPVAYNDTYYLRNGSNNDEVKGVSSINALQDRFKKK